MKETTGDMNILIATRDGAAVCFHESDIRPTGRDAMGVRGIRLREGDYVVGSARGYRCCGGSAETPQADVLRYRFASP